MSNGDFMLAVHALVFLNHKADILTSNVLAENICTNPGRVRQVMARLRKAGLVETREGRKDGGYFFPHAADGVTLRMVSDALDTCFVSADWRSGDSHMECRIASGMAGVMDGVMADLNRACLKRLEHMTIKDIDQLLFGEGARLSEGSIRDKHETTE